MTKYRDGTEIKEFDRVCSPNGRTGTVVKRGGRINTSTLYSDQFTTINDVDGLIDTIIHDGKMVKIN